MTNSCLQAYDGRTFPRLEVNQEACIGGAFTAGNWLNGSIGRLRELGLLEENAAWSLASEREYSQWMKIYMECHRLDNGVSGYEWWLGFDWIAASNGITGGHENAWHPKSGIDNATLRSVQNEVVLLVVNPLTLQSTARTPNETLPVTLVLLNWTFGGHPTRDQPARIVWSAGVMGEAAFASGSVPLHGGGGSCRARPCLSQHSTSPCHRPRRRSRSGWLSVSRSDPRRLRQTAGTLQWCQSAITVFAAADLLGAAQAVCANAVAIPADFAPTGPFVVLTDLLDADVAAATHRHLSAVLLFNPNAAGEFPICATSPIGYVPLPTPHGSQQTWWMSPGTVGTLVYNSSWTAQLGYVMRHAWGPCPPLSRPL